MARSVLSLAQPIYFSLKKKIIAIFPEHASASCTNTRKRHGIHPTNKFAGILPNILYKKDFVLSPLFSL